MKINTVKSKQIKSGVYVLHHGGEIVAADCRYPLPKNSIVVPKNNIVFVKTHRVTYAWKYVSHQKTWRISQLSSVESIEKAIQTVDSVIFDMVVETDEGNKALMLICKNSSGNNTCKHEWRYYTKYFIDLVRSS